MKRLLSTLVALSGMASGGRVLNLNGVDSVLFEESNFREVVNKAKDNIESYIMEHYTRKGTKEDDSS